MSQRTKVVYLLLIAMVGIIVYYLVNPMKTFFVPQCPFKKMTGYSCPGCGMQRGLHALLHGNFVRAFLYNPYLALLSPFLLLIFYETTFATGKVKAFIIRWLENRYTFWIFIVLTFTWWIGRNILQV